MTAATQKIKRRLKQLLARPPAPPPPAGLEAYPNWPQLLEKDWKKWQQAIKRAKGGPRILIPTSVGAYSQGAAFESLLAVALTLRGAEVHFLLCDEYLPACMHLLMESTADPARFGQDGVSREICRNCFRPADYAYRNLGLPVHYYSELVTPEEATQASQIAASIPFEDIAAYEFERLPIGEQAMAGTLRYFARGTLADGPLAEPILRQYLRAALLTMFATRRCLDQLHIQIAAFHHGIYVPQGIIAEVARQNSVRVVVWTVAYRTGCFIGSHADTYHHTLMNEPTQVWENMDWTPAHEAQITEYLRSRWQGTRDWIWFHDMPQEDVAAILRETKIDRSRPVVGALTNVIWDAQLHYPANAFPNMLAWMFETIRYFARRPDLQLVIRIHPAEIRGTVPSRQRMADEIRREFPQLPENIIVVAPESQISTYALMTLCNAAIIYGTKMGVELTSLGLPVIAAGEAWIRNKGLTRDARTAQEYFEILDQLPFLGGLTPAQVQRARKYAYHYFFRRSMPIAAIEPVSGWPPFRVKLSQLSDVLPGHDLGLDVLCDGILTGADFIYPAEKLVSARAVPVGPMVP